MTVIEKIKKKWEGEMLALLVRQDVVNHNPFHNLASIGLMVGGFCLAKRMSVVFLPGNNIWGCLPIVCALSPHGVFENIAFPLTVRKENKNTIRDKVDEIAELVHIGELLQRRPSSFLVVNSSVLR